VIIYEKIPEFDQGTQCIVQLPPVEKDGDIYYGVEIVDLEVGEIDDYVERF
jgi:predicted thioredoxin/glutaredoxin